jgi:hypothetical protein
LSFLLLFWFIVAPSQAITPVRANNYHHHDRYLKWVGRLPHERNPDSYRQISEFHRDIAPWVASKPGVVRPFVVGRTVEKRPIWGFRISRPDREVHTRILVFGGIHALEWISTETAVSFIELLAKMPPDGVEVVVIPLLNIDGRVRVESDRKAGRNVYRRGNARQVDLNRDFEVNREPTAIWRHVIPGYYSHSKAPLSQPESKALDRLLHERFDIAVSLHSFGGFIYAPWAGLWERTDDWKTFYRLGHIMSQAQGAHAYKVRQLSRWGFFFRAQGSELDHIYGKYGTKAFLIELTRSGFEPFRPQTWKEYFRWYNPIEPDRHVDKGVSALRALVYTLSLEGRTVLEE